MFLHGSFMHLFGNMLFLWIYGDNVEDGGSGSFAYLLWYLATGVAATLTHALMFSSSERGMPLVGASGAISGVLRFYFVWFPRNVVRMLAFLPPFLLQVFEIPARWVLGMYLVIDNLLPDLRFRTGQEWRTARIGGFLAGGLVAWLMDRRGTQAQPVRFPAQSQASSGAEVVRLALTERPPRRGRRGLLGACRRPTRAACSRPTRPCRSPAGCGRTATPTRRSRCCGASCATSPQGRGLAEVYAALGSHPAGGPARADGRGPVPAERARARPAARGGIDGPRGASTYRNATEKARGRAATSLLVTLPTGQTSSRVPKSCGGVMSLTTSSTIGRYEIVRELGHGAMGVVYEARDPVLDRTVALKVIKPRRRGTSRAYEERFLAEARIAAQLQHPGIVVVHDVGRDAASGTLFIALELLRGQTLAELARQGRWSGRA